MLKITGTWASALFLISISTHASLAQDASVPVANRKALEGPRIEKYQERLKEVYPTAKRFNEKPLLPSESGGLTLMGLVSRLLGDMPNPLTEGMRSRRYIYQAFDTDKTLGAVHGSLTIVEGRNVPVFIYYDSFGKVVDVRAENLPDAVAKEFNEKGLLKQFAGKDPDYFEVIRGKKGRIKSIAPVMAQSRRPSSGDGRRYFDAIVRSLRFNVSFMEIAHFITQHPELNDHIIAELPQNGNTLALAPANPKSGPEAFVRQKQATSPFTLILPPEGPISGADRP